MGFLFLNFPYGKIFLGDGGAYLLGFMVAGIAVIVPERNADISPFASLLIVAFPFYELIRSTFRRMAQKGESAFQPDNRHLHSLTFKFILQRFSLNARQSNYLSTLLVLLFPAFTVGWSLAFYDNRSLLAIGTFLFILAYEFVFCLSM